MGGYRFDMSVTVVEGDLPAPLACLLASAKRLGVDTETSGLNWASDQLLLCQLFSPESGTVLVRDVHQKPSRLADLMADEAVVKVFHYAPFDLRFLEAQWSIRARRVECTKAASRILDPYIPAAEHSLKPLLQRHLGVQISKGAVRTGDWGAAILSQEQVDYASADVRYLGSLSAELRGRLEATNRHELFADVCAYLPTDAHLAVTGTPNPLNY